MSLISEHTALKRPQKAVENVRKIVSCWKHSETKFTLYRLSVVAKVYLEVGV